MVTAHVRRGYDRGIDLLDRLVPLARALRGALLAYALVVAAAVVVIAGVLLGHDAPGVWFTWLGFVVLVGVLSIAPILLLVFVAMLKEVLDLPAKLRALPDVGPAHAVELAKLVAEARRPPPDGTPRPRPRSMPRSIWQAGRLMTRLHDDIPFPGPLLVIVRVPLLIAVGAAFLVGMFEIVGAVALVVLTAALAIIG